jgi:LytS/YehU family sensor histidine kinase
MIQLLGDFLRHALKQDSVESITLDEEIESLKLYLDIERVRFEDRLNVHIDLDPASLQARVPALLLQPIIENAMKYAISESEDGGDLSISSKVNADKLLLEVTDTGPGLEVTDTGPGFEPDTGEKGRGIGLRNVRERLQTLYGDDHDFTLSDNSPTGLKVSILLPVRFSSEEMMLRKAHEELKFAQA